MEAAAGTRAALAAVAAAPRVQRTLSDDALLGELGAWEAIGRIVDARRIAAAAEVEWRSRPQVGDASLAHAQGAAGGAALVAQVARIGEQEAKRRIGLGAALAPRLSLTGEETPGRYASVSAAVHDGRIGLASARLIVEALRAVRRRAAPEALEAAEEALTDTAATVATDLLHVHAATWQAALDPDGPEPGDDSVRQARCFRLGRTGLDGLTAFSGRTTPENAALLREGIQAHRRGVQMRYADAGGEDSEGAEDLEPGWHEAEGDRRSRAQYDHDVIFGILAAGIRAEQEGHGTSGRTPHEIVVHVPAADLEARRGGGWTDGILARLPVPTIERLQCSGGTRLLAVGDDGEPLHLGRSTRLFSAAQKKALTARDGGCAWPGCTAPAAWGEAHHIRWWHRDHGTSDITNGVLLCSHHHHLVHTSDRWEIRLHDARPHLVPRGWRGDPLPRHRMQRHPMTLRAEIAHPRRT